MRLAEQSQEMKFGAWLSCTRTSSFSFCEQQTCNFGTETVLEHLAEIDRKQVTRPSEEPGALGLQKAFTANYRLVRNHSSSSLTFVVHRRPGLKSLSYFINLTGSAPKLPRAVSPTEAGATAVTFPSGRPPMHATDAVTAGIQFGVLAEFP